jgi:hypothetical protein
MIRAIRVSRFPQKIPKNRAKSRLIGVNPVAGLATPGPGNARRSLDNLRWSLGQPQWASRAAASDGSWLRHYGWSWCLTFGDGMCFSTRWGCIILMVSRLGSGYCARQQNIWRKAGAQ